MFSKGEIILASVPPFEVVENLPDLSRILERHRSVGFLEDVIPDYPSAGDIYFGMRIEPFLNNALARVLLDAKAPHPVCLRLDVLRRGDTLAAFVTINRLCHHLREVFSRFGTPDVLFPSSDFYREKTAIARTVREKVLIVGRADEDAQPGERPHVSSVCRAISVILL